MADTDPTNKTTVARVRSIAKHLSSMSDDDLQVSIDDAYQEVTDRSVPSQYIERLTRYLAAHFASLNVRQSESERVGPMQRTFANRQMNDSKGLDMTTYGQEYKRLLKRIDGSNGLNLVVI
ncbi:MAG: DUF4054 domain-containing protein [Sporolactobacillus sp.]